MMKKTLLLLFAFMATLVSTAQPADVPAPPATDDVYLLYANGGQNGFNFYDWGGGIGSPATVGDTQVYEIGGFKYFGCQFDRVDVSNKKFFHIDIYPMQDMELAAVMICGNEAGNGNEGEKGINLPALTPNQWNSIDIPVQDYLDKGAQLTRLYQIKLVGQVVANAAGVSANDGFANGDGTDRFYIGNEYFHGTRIADSEAPVLVKADAAVVGGNEATLELMATDNNRNVTYTITDAANGKTYSVAGTAGAVVSKTITGLEGNTHYVWTVKAADIAGNLSQETTVEFTTAAGFELTAAPVPTADATKVKALFSDAYTPAASFTIGGWGQSTGYETKTVGGDQVIHLTNYNYLGFEFGTDISLADMNYVHIDVLPRQEMKLGITPIMRGGSKTENSVEVGTLVPNQWNSIDIPLAKLGLDVDGFPAFQLKLDRGTGSEELYVDNIYFYDNGQGNFFIEVADGVATAGGELTAANVGLLNEADAMFIDLTRVTSVGEDVSLAPKHKNALIAVTGKHDGGGNVADAKYAPLGGTPNLVVQDIWLFPVTQIQMVDDPAEPQWMGERMVNKDVKFISTGSTGYRVTRKVPARSFVTAYTTAVVNAADLPAGLTAWEATDYDGTTISFRQVETMAAFFPYVLYNSNETSVDFSFSGTGDFNLVGWSTGNVEAHAVGSANFHGNLAVRVTDGSQWILQSMADGVNGSQSVVFKVGNGAKVSPFRAYFTGMAASGAKTNFVGMDAVTAVEGIGVQAEKTGRIYTVGGVEMDAQARLPKGVYVVNGKKIIIK